MKQQLLFKEEIRNEFGGSLLKKGKRKIGRPLNLKAPIHLVLKADDAIQLFQNAGKIESQIRKLGEKFGVTVYSTAVHEDHIHALLKFPSRARYNAWVRSLTGTLCRQIKGLKWRLRPYTRILTWGRQYHRAMDYLKNNRDEAEALMQGWSRFREFEMQVQERFHVVTKVQCDCAECAGS